MTPQIATLMTKYNRWMNERMYEATGRRRLSANKRAFLGSILGTLNTLQWQTQSGFTALHSMKSRSSAKRAPRVCAAVFAVPISCNEPAVASQLQAKARCPYRTLGRAANTGAPSQPTSPAETWRGAGPAL